MNLTTSFPPLKPQKALHHLQMHVSGMRAGSRGLANPTLASSPASLPTLSVYLHFPQRIPRSLVPLETPLLQGFRVRTWPTWPTLSLSGMFKRDTPDSGKFGNKRLFHFASRGVPQLFGPGVSSPPSQKSSYYSHCEEPEFLGYRPLFLTTPDLTSETHVKLQDWSFVFCFQAVLLV